MTAEDHQTITAEVLNREEFLTFQVCLNPIPNYIELLRNNKNKALYNENQTS